MNEPPRAVCDVERPWGCDYEDVQRTFDVYRRHGIPIKPVQAGAVLYAQGDVRFEVLYAFDGVNTPIGRTDVNDMSSIMLLTHHGTKALFTGDLNRPLGSYLAQHGSGFDAQILKVPHHGAEGVAPNEFFDRVAPRLALAPSPSALWQSDRDQRVREHLQTMGVETLVNGLHGEVTVRFGPAGYTASVERRTAGLAAAILSTGH